MTRIAVIGHVEHVTLGRVPTVPKAGEIRHIAEPKTLAGGGGGIAFFQLAASDAEVHLFTALGNDAAAETVERAVRATGATIHAVRRAEPHTRVVVLIDDSGERTIVVIGEPLHPRADDALPWELLGSMDAVYFTAQDPALLVRARAARKLIVAARRRDAVNASGVSVDVVVGSRVDPREVATRADFVVAPEALILTEGARGGAIETATGVVRFEAPHVEIVKGAYGAGDSFAGALTWFTARGVAIADACARASRFGAAVIGGDEPLGAQLRLTD